MMYLFHATKNKELHYKVDRHGKDWTLELNNDSVSSFTKIKRESVKPSKGKYCQSEDVWVLLMGHLVIPQSLEKEAFSNLSKEKGNYS